ncbi:MAG: 4-hydroxy-3-methylbut-2-enyl diphosphate reductase, partial [Endomicrobia bacterium]|nr:4-hydroxy-3-methylbut-2-enyl diphosphate reductase [Endomicrobiia bacterium]
MKRKIVITKHYGFCSGVRRCITLTEKELQKGTKVYSLGELLHNEQEMARLKKLGVEVIDDIQQLTNTIGRNSLVIRTHGVEKEIYEKIYKLENLNVVDGTCPIVKRNQKIVEGWSKKGFNVIIYGDSSHPEIKALLSYVVNNVQTQIVSCLDDVVQLFLDTSKDTIIVAQTTKPVDEYQQIFNFIKNKYKKIKIFHTICKETIIREKEVLDLAKQVNLVVIIGGKHSANTNK